MLSQKFETALSLLDNPKETIELIIVEKPVFFSLLIFILANVSFLVSNSIVFHFSNTNFALILFFLLLSNFLILAMAAASYHFIAEILKGKGNVITLFSLLSFSLTPVLLMIPSAIIGKFAGTGLTCFAFTVIFFWTIYLLILSIKILYTISILKTLLVIFSPVIIVFILSIILLIISIAGIISIFI
ncbi:MAG: YIP1 family protein [Elusimicrobia bacterium]|nr:YIP1 family protein [Elusimicrobiota bacterium]